MKPSMLREFIHIWLRCLTAVLNIASFVISMFVCLDLGLQWPLPSRISGWGRTSL
jgi:hypothetical protein